MTDPKKRLEEILRQLMNDDLDNDSPLIYEGNIKQTITKILKEFVHKNSLPSEIELLKQLDLKETQYCYNCQHARDIDYNCEICPIDNAKRVKWILEIIKELI